MLALLEAFPYRGSTVSTEVLWRILPASRYASRQPAVILKFRALPEPQDLSAISIREKKCAPV